MQMWSAFSMFLILYVWSIRKSDYDFLPVKFSIKIYRYVPYGYRVFLDSVSFWDAENSKGQSWGSFSKKLAFVTNKCLAQDAFEQLCTQIFLYSRTFYIYKAILVSELYRLSRCIIHVSSF